MIYIVSVNLFPKNCYSAIRHLFQAELSKPVLLPIQNLSTIKKLKTRFALHPDERKQAENFRLAKRRNEYLTGRLCARQALSLFLGKTALPTDDNCLLAIQVVNDQDGRPFFYHAEKAYDFPSLSIAHSGNFGIAVVSPSDLLCGVDLQLEQETLQRISNRFCTHQELQTLADTIHNTEPEIRLLNRIWSAKEAARKMLGYWKLPGFLEMELTPTDILNNGLLVLTLKYIPHQKNASESIRILSGIFRNYSLAITYMPKGSGGN